MLWKTRSRWIGGAGALLLGGGLLALAMGAAPANPATPFRVGSLLVTPAPPHSGFNPLTASPSALAANGFPARPPGTPRWWVKLVTTAQYVYPQLRQMNNTVTTQPAPRGRVPASRVHAASAGNSCSTYAVPSANWAYNMDNCYRYNAIQATWTVPTAVASLFAQNTYSTVWPGLGLGTSSAHQLFQAGSESKVTWVLDRNGWQHYTSTFPWWEVYPQYPYSEEMYSLGISPGNTLHVSVQYIFSKGQVLFTVYNESSNQYVSQYVSAGGFGGYHAEWVAERPEQGGYYSYLANFRSVTFTGAEAESGGVWRGVGQEAHRYGSMYDASQDDAEATDASPGGINAAGNGFAVAYQNPGDRDAP